MKTINLFFMILLCLVPLVSLSQGNESGRVSEEREDTAWLVHKKNTGEYREFTANDVNRLTENLSSNSSLAGAEISASYYYSDYPWIRSNGISLTFQPGSKFFWQADISGYSSYSFLLQNNSGYTLANRSDVNFLFYDPGISFTSRNRKYSLDLYKKSDTQIFIGGGQQVVPYKFKLRF